MLALGHRCLHLVLVLAMVPGYPASDRVGTGTVTAVRVMNRQGTRNAVLAGLLPGPDIKLRCFAGLYPDHGSIFTVRATFAAIKYLSSVRITR